VWITPSCVSDLTAAASDLKREHPLEFGASGASSQAFGLFVFSYSCGCLFGPTLVGVIKAKASWGTATLIMAAVCAAACVPIVSPRGDAPLGSNAHRTCQILKTPSRRRPSAPHETLAYDSLDCPEP